MRIKTIVMSMLLACGALSASGCAKESIPVQSMPAGANFEGRWLTDEFGTLDIVVKPDGSATGVYDYKTGGTMTGKVDGGVLIFEWKQEGNSTNARSTLQGHGYMVISDDGLHIKGKWGYYGSYFDGNGGKEWNGEKQTEIYD